MSKKARKKKLTRAEKIQIHNSNLKAIDALLKPVPDWKESMKHIFGAYPPHVAFDIAQGEDKSGAVIIDLEAKDGCGCSLSPGFSKTPTSFAEIEARAVASLADDEKIMEAINNSLNKAMTPILSNIMEAHPFPLVSEDQAKDRISRKYGWSPTGRNYQNLPKIQSLPESKDVFDSLVHFSEYYPLKTTTLINNPRQSLKDEFLKIAYSNGQVFEADSLTDKINKTMNAISYDNAAFVRSKILDDYENATKNRFPGPHTADECMLVSVLVARHMHSRLLGEEKNQHMACIALEVIKREDLINRGYPHSAPHSELLKTQHLEKRSCCDQGKLFMESKHVYTLEHVARACGIKIPILRKMVDKYRAPYLVHTKIMQRQSD